MACSLIGGALLAVHNLLDSSDRRAGCYLHAIEKLTEWRVVVHARIALTTMVEFRTLQHWAYDYTLVAGALGEAAHSGGAFGAPK